MALDFDNFLAVNEYGFYCIPTSYRERDITETLAEGHVYEPNTLKLLRRSMGDGDIVTGGSFVGDFFPALHGRLAEDAKLYSFEPVPTSFAAAEETIRLNQLNRVHFENVGVGAEAGRMTMKVTRPSGVPIAAGERIVDDVEADGKRFIEIEIKTIDSIVPSERRVSIVHLDVEGFEAQALRGAERVLNDSHPMIVLEVVRPRQKRRYLNLINELVAGTEYQVAGTMERNTFFLPT